MAARTSASSAKQDIRYLDSLVFIKRMYVSINRLNKSGLRGSHCGTPAIVINSLFVSWYFVLSLICESSALMMEPSADESHSFTRCWSVLPGTRSLAFLRSSMAALGSPWRMWLDAKAMAQCVLLPVWNPQCSGSAL